MHVDVAADLRPQQPRIERHPRCAGQTHRVDLVGELVGEPQPQVHPAAPGIVARLHTGQQQSRRERGDPHPAERCREQKQAHHEDPPRHLGKHVEPRHEPQQRARGQQVEQPAHTRDDEQRHTEERLQPLHPPRRRLRRGVLPHRCRRGHGPDRRRHRREPWDVVDVGDGELRNPGADARDELRRRQRPAAEVEEVRGGIGDRHSEHRLPLLREPCLVVAESVGGVIGAREGPRQRGTVDLAGGPHGKVVDLCEDRDDPGGESLGEPRPRGGAVEGGLGDDVSDEHRDSGIRLANGSAGSGHAGEISERGLDLAEFDPAAPDLHLIVGAPLEDEPLTLVAHEIARTVRALPAERGHRRVLLRVLLRVQVAGEADAADDELSRLAFTDPVPVGVDDREHPSVQRQADPHGTVPSERCSAGHDGRLGRAIGVPDLAVLRSQTSGQFGRTRLASEDQQAHVLDRAARPHRGEGRNGRDRGDALPKQPRGEIVAGAHERPRRGDEARAVAPREPHLLARRVEGDRQSREHTTPRRQGRILQEEVRFGVDERRRAAVRDRHALRNARRARGEDDPRVVVDGGRRHRGDRARARVGGGVGVEHRRPGRRPTARGGISRHIHAAGADDPGHRRLAEHERGALVGVVGVDRYIGRSSGQHAEDRHVEIPGAGRHPDADAVAAANTGLVQARRGARDECGELPVAQGAGAVIERRGLRVPGDGVAEDLDERARSGGEGCAIERTLVEVCGHVRRSHPRPRAPPS